MLHRSIRVSAFVVMGIVLGLSWPGSLRAAPICTHLPRFGWVSAEEVEAFLERAGFRLLRLRITNEACYAALVRNERGQILELRIHPATSQIMPLGPMETGTIRR
ncbi:MAG: PepSY domain-containing protein [Rhizobiales bacterium]|mgnify:CR=1 FL=1|nr:PepSY domain-containing protein [Hyphomicrobiales bacterium]